MNFQVGQVKVFLQVSHSQGQSWFSFGLNIPNGDGVIIVDGSYNPSVKSSFEMTVKSWKGEKDEKESA